MAITKILYIDGVEQGNPAKHLKQALNYIQNPDKTEERVLVGSINCLPETAFEQMMETKKIFGKTDKRQGYHIIISFPPGEATEEQAFEITRRFAEEFLGEQYEVVYSVHTDKEHKHGHIVWNSVDMQTGRKYEYKKGDWKYKIQPITNRLCKEYGLAIMPAEYSKEPKNLPRKEWEFEQTFKEMILRDARFCASYAGSKEHFEFLMKRLGYDFKKNEYLTVKMPGRRLYHKLEKMDEMFTPEQFGYAMKYSYKMIPYYYSKNPIYYKRSNMTPFQKKYYRKIYRLRMIEQKRFNVGSAKYAKELCEFHRLQDEYLFLCKNHIETFGGLLNYHTKREERWNEIEARQKEIYKMKSVKKRSCKSEENWSEFQIWNLGMEKELDELKLEKKEVKYQLKLVKNCIYERFDTAIGVIDEEEPVIGSGYIDVPEFEKVRILDEVIDSDFIETGYIEKADVSVGRTPSGIEVESQTEVKPDDPDASMEANFTSIEPMDIDLSHVVSYIDDSAYKKEVRTVMPESYVEYSLLSVEEKVEIFAISDYVDSLDVMRLVKQYFQEIGHDYSIDEVIEESDAIYEEARQVSIRKKVERICNELQEDGLSYWYLMVSEKAKLFEFRVDDNHYNLALHTAALKKLGVDMDFDERYEDYQKVYEAGLEMQRKDKEKDRGR
ncbi:relaxase/mobilization nuclease-like protein [Lachnotalea glycerini]|uniref:Relaxase/mobilization nuclease-like protein n=1 Tax=Lachnotalea glycerini TaxID=1763509 RepID=A0A318ETZ4_9FIRM|nr:relaxase/mobilization nuclease domain-containing protein [Lachnotalea glycerini]PXV91670.1 relaxase/mobilization nuclease-like protein [Lachnotalea glycerini]